jgi:murein DD-endopeptidase MepM/ murein hydrolase activator NlpD
MVMLRVSAFSAAAPSKINSTELIDPDVDYGVVRQADSQEKSNGHELTLSYKFIRSETIDEIIPYKTQYIDDYNNFIGTDTVTQEGSDGLRTVTYEISCDSEGNEIDKSAVDERIITSVMDRIVMVGASVIPEAVPTGTYIWPCVASEGISSGYGGRDLYGSFDFHLGIDIPGDEGTPIHASDGGEVIWAAYSPSYGYSVRILHNNNYITLYAHMKKLLVSVGDKVYQGQQIGMMGHTGAASGTHLHFEVRIGSATVNPTKYLPKVAS